MASNPNQKNTQKQKTGIKTKNKHTIEFTNNTPTIPTKPTKTSRKSQERRPPPQHQGRGDKRKIYTPTTPHVKPKPREPAHTSILLNEVLPALLFLYLCYTLISFSSQRLRKARKRLGAALLDSSRSSHVGDFGCDIYCAV
ncbi:hypothetical protein [Actinomyces sp.]